MPRQVDHEERRDAILRVAKNLIAVKGIAALSFREIARQLGGSTTLVTHYYANQGELFHALAASAVERWQLDVHEIEERTPDPRERLRAIVLDWMLPIVGEDLVDERARINLLAAGLQGEDTQQVLNTWESGVTELLRRPLQEIYPGTDVQRYVDVLRSLYNGLVLSAVEHPDHWTARRQLAVADTMLAAIGLGERLVVG